MKLYVFYIAPIFSIDSSSQCQSQCRAHLTKTGFITKPFLAQFSNFDPCASSMASSILCEIESETRPSSDASEVPDLPSDVEPCEAAAEDTQTTCCQAGCLASLEESPHLQRRVNEMHHILQGSTTDQQESLQFHCMSRWNRSHEAGWRKYQAWGMPLCTHALEFVLKLSRHKRQKFKTKFKRGL